MASLWEFKVHRSIRGALRKTAIQVSVHPSLLNLRACTYRVFQQFQNCYLSPGERGQQRNTETQCRTPLNSRLRNAAFVKDNETRSCPAFIWNVSVHTDLSAGIRRNTGCYVLNFNSVCSLFTETFVLLHFTLQKTNNCVTEKHTTY